MIPDEDDDLLLRQLTDKPWYREPEVFALVLLAIVGALYMAFGCAHVPPDSKPKPQGKVEAHLDAFPPLMIGGQMLTLHAWLDDPESIVRCPTVTWTKPDGTRSSRTSDCDPDERVTRHSEIRQGRLSSAEVPYVFRVDFDSEGKRWSAQTQVEVK